MTCSDDSNLQTIKFSNFNPIIISTQIPIKATEKQNPQNLTIIRLKKKIN